MDDHPEQLHERTVQLAARPPIFSSKVATICASCRRSLTLSLPIAAILQNIAQKGVSLQPWLQ
jgi:hypothetical protein